MLVPIGRNEAVDRVTEKTTTASIIVLANVFAQLIRLECTTTLPPPSPLS